MLPRSLVFKFCIWITTCFACFCSALDGVRLQSKSMCEFSYAQKTFQSLSQASVLRAVYRINLQLSGDYFAALGPTDAR